MSLSIDDGDAKDRGGKKTDFIYFTLEYLELFSAPSGLNRTETKGVT